MTCRCIKPCTCTATEVELTGEKQWRPVIVRVLKHGDRGGDVRALQLLVGVPLTSHYDHATVVAVTLWQQAHGLEPDGLFGPISAGAAGWSWRE